MTKNEIITAFESVGLAIPTFIKNEDQWECVWHVDTEDLGEEADEIKAALTGTSLDYDRVVYTTWNDEGGQVIIYVED